jgi:uncharacterized membrane protein YdjX (TVP38/TMEM64 family)
MTQVATGLLRSRPALVRLAVLAATLLTIGWLVDRWGLRNVLETQWVDHQIKGQGWSGLLLFVTVAALSMSIGIPRQISAFLAGYAFGVEQGTVLAILATILAATGGFFYARYMGREWLGRRFPKATQWLDQFLAQNTFVMVVALRLVPFSSNLATNLAAGVSGAPYLPFLIASILGYAPQTIAFALLGQGVQIDPVTNIILVAGLIVVSTALGLYLWRKSAVQRS